MKPTTRINPLSAELDPFCHLLTLLGADDILHVSGIRVKLLQFLLKQVTCFKILTMWFS